ncbi:MAG: hypothetical protein JXR94_01775 [Candidatus Hydrogenedentes bacterium]|nr:hypothetical protein [Candidatus Hydrogenedentota bacterium]
MYDIATTLAAPLGAVRLALSSRHRPLLRRFAPPVPPLPERPIWIQACSVGEVSVAKSLLGALRERWPDTPVLLTCSTVAGRAQADSACADVARAWFPFDHALSVRRFIRQARPRALVLVETELWPNVLRGARRHGVPVVIVNGRLSDKHFPRYRRFRRWLRPALRCITAAGMQNQEYAGRLAELGVDPGAIHVTGNTKFDGVATDVPAETRARLRAENGFQEDQPILLFGSTRPGDETLASQCWRELREEFPALRLVIAPRHLKRLDEATAPFDEPLLFRSQVREGRAPAGERVLILDTMGELVAFYASATVAVIGGSFFPGVEGHNPLEPAALGVPTVFGPYMRNFVDPARVLVEGGGAEQVARPDELAGALRVLLRDPERRAAMAARGRAAVLANRGAIGRNLDVLEAVLEGDDAPQEGAG